MHFHFEINLEFCRLEETIHIVAKSLIKHFCKTVIEVDESKIEIELIFSARNQHQMENH